MSTEVPRYEFRSLEQQLKFLDQRVERLEKQRRDDLEERAERSWRHTRWMMNGVMIVFVGAAVILWTVHITLAVTGD